jgi:hypothetical protein
MVGSRFGVLENYWRIKKDKNEVIAKILSRMQKDFGVSQRDLKRRTR